ncbi:unnamed protein product [Clonostachys solani]|uniref:Major facilitator superfamily (MFS) profile domain-containing protein n=1 Tax=Clonostachys solani TaxID=160281 RepID=A0A9P0ETU8_9HYPO|nr:unnamed protein product [Clonostachys solani]
MSRSSSEETQGPSHDELASSGYGIDATTKLTPEENVIAMHVRKKVDYRILPITLVVYLLDFVDRNNYSLARLQGLEADLGLTESEYQAGLSLFFVGYLLGQVPANLLLNRFARPSYHLAFFTCIWGIISTCTGLSRGFRSLAVCRFLLGFAEAPFFPGVIFCLSKWYTKQELAFRVAIFSSGNLISGAFASLIAAGILEGIGHARGLAPWQWLYLVTGPVTILVGLFVWIVLPDFPENWKGLSPEERRVAILRVAIDGSQADIDEPGMTQFKGLKMALTDVNTYVLGLAYMCIIGSVGFGLFLPSLTASLGYSHTVSLLLCTPPYIFMTIWLIVHSWLSDRWNSRFWFYMYPLPISIVGFVIFMTADQAMFAARYVSLFLMPFVSASAVSAFSWVSSSISRPPAKRAAAFAIINCFATSASIWVPFVYIAPRYTMAMIINIVLCVCAGILGVVHLYVLVWRNRKLARIEECSASIPASPGRDDVRMEGSETKDVGKVSKKGLNRGFRYML